MRKWIMEDPFRFWVMALCVVGMMIVYVINECNPNVILTKPIDEVQVTDNPTNGTMGSGVVVSIGASVSLSTERPAPPTNSVVITNGEDQIRILMGRHKQTGTN